MRKNNIKTIEKKHNNLNFLTYRPVRLSTVADWCGESEFAVSNNQILQYAKKIIVVNKMLFLENFRAKQLVSSAFKSGSGRYRKVEET